MIRPALMLALSSALTFPGLQVPSVQVPTIAETPVVGPAVTQAWNSIPPEVKDQFDLPSPMSSQVLGLGQAGPAPAGPAAHAVNLQPIVDAAVARYGGTASVAVSNGHSVIVAGDDRRHLALSTIKVPLSIAALRQSPNWYADAERAITWSDNAATSRMWNGVGAGSVAQVIAESGSTSGPTSWHGSTAWSASEQARFMANLSCTPGSAPVLDMMGRITPDQRWGLGRIPGARFKGGWSPVHAEGGRWVVRQMGLVPGPRGQVAVAFTAVPASGSFEDGKAMNDMIAEGIRAQLGILPTARCQ